MNCYELSYVFKKQTFKGFVAEPDDVKPKTPVVLIVHMWSGRVGFVDEKAKEMDSKGYIGFAIDMYGAGQIGQSVNQNTQLMQPFIDDRSLMQSHVQAGFKAVSKIPKANSKKVVAIGYCFGGLCVQDLARVNSHVKGIVSIHGLMLAPDNMDHGKFKAKVLILNGADDPMVGDGHWLKLREELNHAKCDWQKHDFGGVMHAFTNPYANDKSMGTVYNETANARSEKLIDDFILECIQ